MCARNEYTYNWHLTVTVQLQSSSLKSSPSIYIASIFRPNRFRLQLDVRKEGISARKSFDVYHRPSLIKYYSIFVYILYTNRMRIRYVCRMMYEHIIMNTRQRSTQSERNVILFWYIYSYSMFPLLGARKISNQIT